MAFSPDGRFLAAGDWKGKLFTWSATDGKLLNKRDVGQMIRFVCATADEIAVIAGGEVIAFDHGLKVERWRVKIGDVQETCLYLSGKDRRSIGWDRDRLVILALDTGKEICGAKLVLQDKGYPKQTTISSDGRLICVIHGEQFILLDSTLRELGRRSIEYANAAVFSPDSSWLGLASWSKGELWSVERFSTLASSPPKLDGPARADAK